MWIKSAEYIEDYKIKVIFEDYTERLLDIKPFLLKSQHPGIRQFLDINKFKKFSVKFGSLSWEGNQFDLGHEGIYNGDFDAKQTRKRKTKKTPVD